MSWTHLREEEPIARKEHTCGLCGLAIKKGEKYVARTGIRDGDIHTFPMHPICEEVTQSWHEEDWECSGDYVEFRRELAEHRKPLTVSGEIQVGASYVPGDLIGGGLPGDSAAP